MADHDDSAHKRKRGHTKSVHKEDTENGDPDCPSPTTEKAPTPSSSTATSTAPAASMAAATTTTTTSTATASATTTAAAPVELPGSPIESSVPVSLCDNAEEDCIEVDALDSSQIALSHIVSMRALLRSSSRVLPEDSARASFSTMQTIGGFFTLCKVKGSLLANIKLSYDKHYLMISPVVKAGSDYKFTVMPNYPKLVLLAHVVEILQGQFNPSFLKCGQEEKVDCSFSLLCKNGETFDLVAENKAAKMQWVNSLEKLIDSTLTPILRFIDSAWRSESFTWINFEQTLQLLQKLNFKPAKNSLKTRFNEVAVDKPGFINYANFRVLIISLLNRREIAECFSKLTNAGKKPLGAAEILEFHKTCQSETEDFTPEDAAVVIRRFGENRDDHGAPVMPTQLLLHEFEAYLLSKHNSIFHPAMSQIHQDMTAPLTFYYINGFTSFATPEGYFRFLKKGNGRYLEIVILDGKEEYVDEILRLVKEFAFKINPFPVILYLRIKCGEKQQERLVSSLKTILGDSLAKPLCEAKPDLKYLPSPAALKNRVLLMGKLDDVTEDLGNMLFLHACTPATFPEDLDVARPWDVLLIAQKNFDRFEPSKLIEHSRRFITQVRPSKKWPPLEPCSAWASGIQLAPVSPTDFTASLAEGKFILNGGCGYQRKQWFMTLDPISFEDVVSYPSAAAINTVNSLTVEVLSARVLPKSEGGEARTVNPLVELELFGDADDHRQFRTKPIVSNGFNPEWMGKCEPFVFPLTASSHAMLLIRIMDGAVGRELAHYSLPVNCIRPGLRVVHLKSFKGKLPPPCTLFLRVAIDVNKTPRYPLCDQLEPLPKKLLAFSSRARLLGKIFGPDEFSEPGRKIPDTGVFARGISTYPIDRKTKAQLGSPICDQYAVACFSDRTAYCIADGCNWGPAPREAAQKATATFVQVMEENVYKQKTIRDMGQLLARALVCANRAISDGMSIGESAGTTTFLGGVVIPYGEADVSSGHKRASWCCLNLSLGDCKIFCWRAKDKKVIDIGGTARGSMDGTDPGGRLGPYKEFLKPDLRNLRMHHSDVSTGDLLILMSDGIHDNFDAPSLGMKPKDVDPTNLADFTAWDVAYKAKPETTLGAQQRYMVANINKFTSSLLEKFGGNIPEPEIVTNAFMDYCYRLTSASRDFMENNPRTKLPADYTRFPGKLDHTTCVCIKVGHVKPPKPSTSGS